MTVRPQRWTRAEKFVAILGLVMVVAFGLVTLRRTAWRWRPLSDLTVYLRAAWAVGEGISPYQVTNEFGWHYLYPPLLAMVLQPLGEPPPPEPPKGMPAFRGLHADNLKLTFSVAFIYLLSVAMLVAGVHRLATALEGSLRLKAGNVSPQPRGEADAAERQRWWLLRAVPVLVCLPGILITLSRGQVELLLLMGLMFAVAAATRGKWFRAGLWIALLICVKVLPVALLLYPLWRGKWRCLAGCAAGLAIGLVAIPIAAVGPERTLAFNQEFAQVVLLPGMGLGHDRSRASEIMDMNVTDNASILRVLHNLTHLSAGDAGRPQAAESATRLAALAIAAAMVGATLAAAGWRRQDSPEAIAIFFGLLTVEMLVGNSVCHRHYFSLLAPLVMGIVAAIYGPLRHKRLHIVALVVFGLQVALTGICSLPGIRETADFWGVALLGVMLTWTVGIVALWKLRGPKRDLEPANAGPAGRGIVDPDMTPHLPDTSTAAIGPDHDADRTPSDSTKAPL